jgi:hypothetical protein
VILALKLVLTPTIVVLSTLAGRRFGRIASGWLIALPLTSGPIAAFFAVEHGRAFATHSAIGSLGGAIGESAFCVAYAAAARRAGWRVAVVAGSAGYVGVAAVLEQLPLAAHWDVLLPLAAAAAGSLVVGVALVPHVPPRGEPALPSRWDVPARAVVSTAFLLGLTAAAAVLGARLSGLIAVYPLYTVVLAAFAHAHEGEHGAVQVLRGLLLGLYSFVAFYLVLATALPRLQIAPAFAAAFAAALAVQAASLLVVVRAAPARTTGLA